jgi:hypothetical protein
MKPGMKVPCGKMPQASSMPASGVADFILSVPRGNPGAVKGVRFGGIDTSAYANHGQCKATYVALLGCAKLTGGAAAKAACQASASGNLTAGWGSGDVMSDIDLTLNVAAHMKELDSFRPFVDFYFSKEFR